MVTGVPNDGLAVAVASLNGSSSQTLTCWPDWTAGAPPATPGPAEPCSSSVMWAAVAVSAWVAWTSAWMADGSASASVRRSRPPPPSDPVRGRAVGVEVRGCCGMVTSQVEGTGAVSCRRSRLELVLQTAKTPRHRDWQLGGLESFEALRAVVSRRRRGPVALRPRLWSGVLLSGRW